MNFPQAIIFYSTEIEGGNVLPGVEDICASYQYALTKHLVRQTQKAMIYVAVRELLSAENQTLVCVFHLFYLWLSDYKYTLGS